VNRAQSPALLLNRSLLCEQGQHTQRISKALLSEGQCRGVERIENTGLALLGLKSKRSRRTDEMPARLARLLVELRQKQIAGDSKFVFQDELGRPLDPDFVYSVLHTAQDAAEVERFGLHGLRHLYCSLLVNSGAQVQGCSATARARVGHDNPGYLRSRNQRRRSKVLRRRGGCTFLC
jgi:integrase